MSAPIAAGFPSPAEEHIDEMIDLNRLVGNQPATFCVRVRGESMTGAGIFSGDMLVVDRSLEARDGSIVVARIDDGFTVKRWRRIGGSQFLVAENPDFPRREITADTAFEIWGVVTYAIHDLCRT
jgi:DNA polymerase V